MGKIFQTLIFLLFLFFSIGLADAATFQQNTNIDIKHPVRIDGNIPANTLCNITIYYPNNSLLVDFKEMTDKASYFNYTINSTFTGTKGTYNYDILCTNGTLSSSESFQFLINLGGVSPTQERTDTSTRNIVILFGLAFLSFIGLMFTKKFPVKATLFLVMIWLILSGLSISFVSLQDEVLNPTVENFFSMFLTMAFYINWFIFVMIMVLWVATFFTTIFQYNKKKKEEKYGGD